MRKEQRGMCMQVERGKLEQHGLCMQVEHERLGQLRHGARLDVSVRPVGNIVIKFAISID